MNIIKLTNKEAKEIIKKTKELEKKAIEVNAKLRFLIK